VVAVFDSGCLEDGSPYVVVQRLNGQSLAARLASGPLPVAEAVDVALQVASALSALSAAGITHRDVKPDNLVLEPLPDGRTLVKLVDFGIALENAADGLRESEGLVGTPHYMAPEQVSGDAIDPRCDLYALGATFYEMLTGRPPHNGESLNEIARAILFAPIAPLRSLRPDCPPGLEAIIMRALAREPGQRFSSARALKQALERWQAGEIDAVRTSSPTPLEDTLRVPTRRPERRRARRGLSIAFGLAAALGLGLLTTGWQRAGHELGAEGATATASLDGRGASAALELLLQAGPLARGVVLHASAAAAELFVRANSSAGALLERIQHQTAAWESQVRGQLLEPNVSSAQH
jgi:eukaryotic-like serine/threonine-protein kinase